MTEKHGNIKDLSYESSKASLFWKTVCYVGTRPVNLICYCVSWFHLYSLCQYGRLYRNIPVLLLCLAWWIGVAGYGVYLWICYGKKGLVSESWNIISEIKVEDVKWYIRRKGFCQFFMRNKTVFTINLQGTSRDEEDFLDLKLSAANALGKRKYRLAAGILLAAVTLYGSFLVVISAIPYHGKLSWYLQELQNKRSVALMHDNIYESGIEGILEDVREKVQLPEKLCLATSFNLHFAPDGTVQTFDTMLYGFDKNSDFIDSYLITYNAARSRKIDIYLGGASGAVFDIDKDLQPLIEAVSAMPLRETVKEWKGQECFGILYYGIREWHGPEGIRYLNHKGESRMPSAEEYYFSGYSVSVFCPENETIVPVRYLYMGYQDFPEEEVGYVADYYPEGSTGHIADDEADTESGQSVHATGNIWRTCTDYPLEQYGDIQQTKEAFVDRNGEVIYEYWYANFAMKEDVSGAQAINAFLEAKKAETIKGWQAYGQQMGKNSTVAEDYYLGNNPTDSMTFQCLTYLEENYCSLVFFGQNYTGGVSALPYLCTYTINRDTGNEGWGDGFYLTKEGIAFYHGFAHIAWEGEGLIEVVVPWEEDN